MRIVHHTKYTDTPLPCTAWNEEHDVSMVGFWKLIEKRTVPSGTVTTTFTGLDGDSDKKYLIEFELDCVRGSNAGVLHIRPNGDSGNNYKWVHHIFATWAHGSYIDWQVAVMGIGITTEETNDFVRGRSIFYAERNAARTRKRYCTGMEIDFRSDTRLGRRDCVAWWTNTTDNITSLEIRVTNGSFSGTFWLYKWVEG